MNENQAELTTVLEHDASGRILRFVKTVVPLAVAESMKAKALLRAEELKAATLLQDADSIIEKAQAPAPASERKPTAPAAPRPVTQQRAAPRAAAISSPDDVVPVRDATVPARQVAKLKRAQLEVERIRATIAETKALMAEAKALISKKTIEAATYAGKECGRASMKAALARIPASVPAGTRLEIEGKQFKAIICGAWQQLCDQKYCPTVHTHEFGQAFADAFAVGVQDAVAEFESTPRRYPAPQATDAGATQDDKLCQTEP